ncbi:hypothetical protein BDN70DRAFT_924105 [Pholiota conissans]|uniref:Uncharacterized protein n=1 Tax=Pholiota conissans TaxID=109636 RepID=A0A9P5YTM9_9AGAR|nr:hypothetical protein BDN70DRAFT_924105 [Pholiota conissans]
MAGRICIIIYEAMQWDQVQRARPTIEHRLTQKPECSQEYLSLSPGSASISRKKGISSEREHWLEMRRRGRDGGDYLLAGAGPEATGATTSSVCGSDDYSGGKKALLGQCERLFNKVKVIHGIEKIEQYENINEDRLRKKEDVRSRSSYRSASESVDGNECERQGDDEDEHGRFG